jgi:diacylglycerol kinase family enzyme/membrane-associated phospholipid phosphatase
VITRAAARLQTADERLFDFVARRDLRVIDKLAPRLTSAADRGGLWLATAAILSTTGKRGRRAGVAGMMSLGLASAVANGPAKWVARRQRPQLAVVPLVRQLAKQPRTSSFPSGHSASAAAFATAVALESPARAVPVVAVAALVAYGRVHTGVHYPLDVAAGVGLGVGCALVVRRLMPAPDDAQPARCAVANAPALVDGDGLVLVVNAGAPSVQHSVDALLAMIQSRLPRAEVVVVGEHDSLEASVEAAAARARVLGVAGGDGTVGCAAAAALRRGIPLAVFPAGTLNHFAGALGVAEPEQVTDAIRRGEACSVSVGAVDEDLVFLNTFSIGVYPELVERRESRERWLGKWPALAVALVEVLVGAEPVAVAVDGVPRRVWSLFAGNGRYHPAGFLPASRTCLDEQLLDVRLVDADRRLSRTSLALTLLTGGLSRRRGCEESVVGALLLRLEGDDPRIARDGESHSSPRNLRLAPTRTKLVVYRPTPR